MNDNFFYNMYLNKAKPARLNIIKFKILIALPLVVLTMFAAS